MTATSTLGVKRYPLELLLVAGVELACRQHTYARMHVAPRSPYDR